MSNTRGALLTVTAGVALVLVLFTAGSAVATSANISHSFKATQNIGVASIVSLDANSSGYVEPANIYNGGRIFGVVVGANESLLAVDEAVGSIQVATSGSVDALVSTLNGPIKLGDKIAVSPFSGIGMKSDAGSRVVGLAQSSFDEKSEGAKTKEVTDKSGKKSTISIGLVNISIAIGVANAGEGREQISSLQKIGKSLTGHTVSNFRVIVSMAVAAVAMISLITLIYASIYGGVISVGRNPLAKYAVLRTLATIMVMVVATAAIAGATIFLLLR